MLPVAAETSPPDATPQSCPLCGGLETATLYTLVDPAFVTARCKACRFTFMNPYPTDEFLHAYYLSTKLYGFGSDDPEAYRRSMEDRVVLFDTLFRVAGLTPGTGFAVDFGAGMGMAVAALKQLGFDASRHRKEPASRGRRQGAVRCRDSRRGTEHARSQD